MLCCDRVPRGALCLCMLALLAGCAGGSGTAPAQQDTAPPAAAQTEAEPAPQAVRPNTPTMYEPQSPGTSALGTAPLRADVSNTARGYVTVCYDGTAAKANIQLTGPYGVTYKYFLPPAEAWVPLPLSGGSGAYAAAGYENTEGSSYTELFKESFEASLENELLPVFVPQPVCGF